MTARSKSYSLHAAKRHPLVPSRRLFVAILLLAVCVVVNMNYNGFNFAIICMVNATYLKRQGLGNASEEPRSCGGGAGNESMDDYHGSFLWDRTVQSNLLAAEGLGAVWLILISGMMVDKYGTKIPLLGGICLLAATSALMPTAAHLGWPWVFACRILQGIGIEISWPALFAVCTWWFPISELGIASGFGFGGFTIGNMIAPFITGYFCSSSLGWQGSFYFTAVTTAIIAVCWAVFYENNNQSVRISDAEAVYIKLNRSIVDRGSKQAVPFRKILTSFPVWAVVMANFCIFYAFFFLADFGPTYLKEFLGFGSSISGILMTIPFIAQLIVRLASGVASDFIAKKVSMTITVKAFNTACGFGMAVCLASMTFFNCTNRIGAVGFMIATYLFCGLALGGFLKSTCLIAPQFTGTISGLSTTALYFAVISVPYVTGFLNPDSTEKQWKSAFYIAIAVTLTGTIFFLLFGSGVRQSWARVDDGEKSISTISVGGQSVRRHESVAAVVGGRLLYENVIN